MKGVSYRKAIDNMCKSCIYDPLSGLGTWRQQTEGCTCTDCPLYHVRPVSSGLKGSKSEALAQESGNE